MALTFREGEVVVYLLSRMFAEGKEEGALSDLQLAKNKNNQAVNQS